MLQAAYFKTKQFEGLDDPLRGLWRSPLAHSSVQLVFANKLQFVNFREQGCFLDWIITLFHIGYCVYSVIKTALCWPWSMHIISFRSFFRTMKTGAAHMESAVSITFASSLFTTFSCISLPVFGMALQGVDLSGSVPETRTTWNIIILI